MNRLPRWSKIWVPVFLAACFAGGVLVWQRPRPRRALEDLPPQKVAAFRSLYKNAVQQIRQGEFQEALASIEKCLAIYDGDEEVYSVLGQLYVARRLLESDGLSTEDEEDKLLDRALVSLDHAIGINPACVSALRTRFEIRRVAKLRRYDPDVSLADGEEILRIEPEDRPFRMKFALWLLSGVRFRRARGGQMSYDSMIGLEVAERHLERIIDRAPLGSDANTWALNQIGHVYLYMGDFDRAAKTFDQVHWPSTSLQLRARTLINLGIALYRLGRYEEAAKALAGSLEIRTNPEAAWLLRLVYAEMGRAMSDLPLEYRFPLPDEEFDRERQPKLRFTEMGKELGVAKLDGAGPSAFADYDNDGDPDILAAGCDTYTALYRNDGDHFRDVTIEAGLDKVESGFSTNMVDYDNDGHLDIYICRNGWSGPGPNILLRNRGDGTFEDRSRASGLDDSGCGFVSLWADFDGDGPIDVYICNGTLGDGSTNRLYRSKGGGTFEDVTDRAGLAESRRWSTIGAAVGDYDRDGDPDIFVNGRWEAPNRLYRNRGDGTFDEVAEEVGVTAPSHNGYVAFFLDYDNDAHPDILTTSLAMWHPVLAGMARKRVSTGPHGLEQDVPRLYRNNRDGTFGDVTFEARLVYPHGVMGANVADLDNDGHVDLYLGTGSPNFGRLEPTVFYWNKGDGTFENLSRYARLDHPGKGHGFTFADVDQDGDLDIYAPQGGFWHGDLWENPFYRNEEGSEHHWIHLRLRGVKSNQFAVGAQVTARIGEMIQYREVEGGIGFGSTNSYPVEFGLGQRSKVDEVEILWPSGHRQILHSPPVDTMIEVVELEKGWRVVHKGGSK